MPCDACAANQQLLGRRCNCMPPLWYLFSLPDTDPPCTQTAASYSSSSSSSRMMKSAVSTTTTMDKNSQKQCSKVSFPEIEIPADLIIRVGDSIFPLHKAVMMPKCSYIRRAVAALASKNDNDDDPKQVTTTTVDVIELDLSSLPGGAAAFEKVARYCYGANFEITPHNAAALRCAASFLDMRHPSADLARRVDDFLSRGGGDHAGAGALRSLPSAVAVLRSCEAPGLLQHAEELGVVRRAADAVALAVCREALSFPFSSSSASSNGGPGWWKAELAALSPRSFGKVVTALRCRRADPAVIAAAAGSYAELALAEVLAGPRDCADHRKLLEAVVDVLPSSSSPAEEIPAALLCRLLHAAVSTEASAKACRDLELRVAAVLDKGVTADDLLAVALDAAGDRVRYADTVRRVVSAFFERHSSSSAAAAVKSPAESERRRSRRASMSAGTATAAAAEEEHGRHSASASAMEKVARMVDEVAAEVATEEALPVSKFVGVAGAVPRDARRASHDGLYRAVDVYLKTHPALDEIQREKVCSVMDPLRLSYQARLHAAQNKRLPLNAALTALYYDQLKLRSADNAAATAVPHVPAAAPAADTKTSTSSPVRAREQKAKADEALARENEALRVELARMRAYMSGMQQQQYAASPAPRTPAAVGRKASFLGTELARVRAYMSGMHGHGHHHHGGSKGSASVPASPARSSAAAGAARNRASSFFGSASRTLSRLNPFRGGGGGAGWTAGKHAGGVGGGGGRQCKTVQHVVTPKRRRSSIG